MMEMLVCAILNGNEKKKNHLYATTTTTTTTTTTPRSSLLQVYTKGAGNRKRRKGRADIALSPFFPECHVSCRWQKTRRLQAPCGCKVNKNESLDKWKKKGLWDSKGKRLSLAQGNRPLTHMMQFVNKGV